MWEYYGAMHVSYNVGETITYVSAYARLVEELFYARQLATLYEQNLELQAVLQHNKGQTYGPPHTYKAYMPTHVC